MAAAEPTAPSRGPGAAPVAQRTLPLPQADVARTCVLFESAKLPAESPPYMHLLLRISRQLLHRTYLRRYATLTHTTLESINRFLPIQRAARSAMRNGMLM